MHKCVEFKPLYVIILYQSYLTLQNTLIQFIASSIFIISYLNVDLFMPQLRVLSKNENLSKTIFMKYLETFQKTKSLSVK